MVLSGHWPSSKDKSEGPCDGHSQCAQRQTARLRVSLEPDSSRTRDTAAALELRVRGLFNNGTNDLVSPFFGSDLFLTTIFRT